MQANRTPPAAGTWVSRKDIHLYDWPKGTQVRNHKRALLDPEDVCPMACCEDYPVQVMERRDY